MLTTLVGAIQYVASKGSFRPCFSNPGVLFSMVGKTKDPKGTRITVRISDKDLRDLQTEAKRRNISVGGVIRTLIRDGMRFLEPMRR
jgi:Ribbon-helix-helix protein, copG family